MNRSQKGVMQSFRAQVAMAPMTNVRIQFRMPILLRPTHVKQVHPLAQRLQTRQKPHYPNGLPCITLRGDRRTATPIQESHHVVGMVFPLPVSGALFFGK